MSGRQNEGRGAVVCPAREFTLERVFLVTDMETKACSLGTKLLLFRLSSTLGKVLNAYKGS